MKLTVLIAIMILSILVTLSSLSESQQRNVLRYENTEISKFRVGYFCSQADDIMALLKTCEIACKPQMEAVFDLDGEELSVDFSFLFEDSTNDDVNQCKDYRELIKCITACGKDRANQFTAILSALSYNMNFYCIDRYDGIISWGWQFWSGNINSEVIKYDPCMARVGRAEAERCEAACASEGTLMNEALDALNTTGQDDAVDVVAAYDYLTYECR